LGVASTRWIKDHYATAAFVAAEVVALPLLLVWGRHGWFTQDDWDFLSARTIGSAHDLFRAHFQHWTTLPILPYRLLWTMVGIRSYTPYQALIVVTHLIAAALVFTVIRRAGVRPWLATIAAILFVYFGAGAENILVAFQITFVGALAFGLGQLLLADHDGPLARRDWLGLLAGFAGLMCSGVSITMTVVVGVAILLRRGVQGWRAALFHSAPLAAAYVLWLALAPKGQSAGSYRSHSATQVIRFAWSGAEGAFARLGQVPGAGIALALLLFGGLFVLFRARGRRGPLDRLAVPVALLAGALLFLVVTGVARAAQGGLRARESRYLYMVAAMALPAVAVAADALISRWRRLTIPVIAVLLLGFPGNVRQLADSGSVRQFKNAEATRSQLLALGRLPLVDQLRDSRWPVTVQNPRYAQEGLTYGWLVKGVESGRIPAPTVRNKFQAPTEVLLYFLVPSQVRGPVDCAPVPAIRTLEKGQLLTVERGKVFITYAPLGATPSLRLKYGPSTLKALVGPLRLRIVPIDRGARICE
jgi:hypothetical protein